MTTGQTPLIKASVEAADLGHLADQLQLLEEVKRVHEEWDHLMTLMEKRLKILKHLK